jgi:hypothetical protein
MEKDGGASGQVAAVADSQRWAAATLTLAGIGLVLLFAVLPHGLFGDGYVRYRKLTALLGNGILLRDRYSFIGPLFAAPLWLFHGSREWWYARFNVLVLATGAISAWWVLRSVLTREERATVALLLVGSGMMPSATHDFYGEMFSAVMTGTGLLLVTTGRPWPGWLAVVLGVANTPATVVGLLAVAMWRVWRNRRFDGAAALALATALILLENTIVRGAPLDAGYAGDHGAITVMPYSGMPGFSYPLILGVLSLLFSFGKGLLFFAPGLLLVAHARRVRPPLAPFLDLSVVFVAGLLLVYSRWWAWYGGWTWGPRFLLFAVYPSSLALAVTLRAPGTWSRSVVVTAITAWTAWVGVSGAVFGLDGLDVCIANGYALEHLCWYVPDYSPLLHPLVFPPATLTVLQQVWMIFAATVVALLLTSGPALSTIADELRAALGGRADHGESGG